jgi:hypothetical protein
MANANETLQEAAARAAMIAQHGRCDVTDWREREWNPNVADAWAIAEAVLAVVTAHTFDVALRTM